MWQDGGPGAGRRLPSPCERHPESRDPVCVNARRTVMRGSTHRGRLARQPVDTPVEDAPSACGAPVDRRVAGWGGVVEPGGGRSAGTVLTSHNVVHRVWTKMTRPGESRGGRG